MIARIWNGKTHIKDEHEYTQFVFRKMIPDYQSTDGYITHSFLKRRAGEIMHFKIITYWESLEVIKNFAGSDIDQAKYYTEDIGFLLDFPERVFHYEVSEVLSEEKP